MGIAPSGAAARIGTSGATAGTTAGMTAGTTAGTTTGTATRGATTGTPAAAGMKEDKWVRLCDKNKNKKLTGCQRCGIRIHVHRAME